MPALCNFGPKNQREKKYYKQEKTGRRKQGHQKISNRRGETASDIPDDQADGRLPVMADCCKIVIAVTMITMMLVGVPAPMK